MPVALGILAALLLLPVALSAEDPPSPSASSEPAVAVVLDFDQDFSPTSLVYMEREIESIFNNCAIHVRWRLLDESTSKEAFNHLVMARFKGACRNEDGEDAGRSHTLAITHVAEGEILPFSEVDCDRVRRFVQPQIAQEAHPKRDMLLGKALGRVLAHELYHVLTRSKRHAETGLAKATLSLHDLVGNQLRFDRQDADNMRRSLQPPRVFRSSTSM